MVLAGIYCFFWIPASAGMTSLKAILNKLTYYFREEIKYNVPELQITDKIQLHTLLCAFNNLLL